MPSDVYETRAVLDTGAGSAKLHETPRPRKGVFPGSFDLPELLIEGLDDHLGTTLDEEIDALSRHSPPPPPPYDSLDTGTRQPPPSPGDLMALTLYVGVVMLLLALLLSSHSQPSPSIRYTNTEVLTRPSTHQYLSGTDQAVIQTSLAPCHHHDSNVAFTTASSESDESSLLQSTLFHGPGRINPCHTPAPDKLSFSQILIGLFLSASLYLSIFPLPDSQYWDYWNANTLGRLDYDVVLPNIDTLFGPILYPTRRQRVHERQLDTKLAFGS